MSRMTYLLAFLLLAVIVVASNKEYELDYDNTTKTRRELRMAELKHEADSLAGILPTQQALVKLDSLIEIKE